MNPSSIRANEPHCSSDTVRWESLT